MKKFTFLLFTFLGLLYSVTTPAFLTSDKSSFPLSSDCVNPAYGGKIGSKNDVCQGGDPDILANISFPSGHTGTLEYKWQMSTSDNPYNFVDIPDSNSPDYDPPVLPKVTWFKRLARVDCMPDWKGAAESNIVYIKVKAPPVIVAHPVNVAACPWETVIFTVKATGDDVQYQWYKKGNPDIKLKDGGNIWGTGSNGLVIYQPGIADAKDYYAVAYNYFCDPVQSKVAKLALKELIIYPKAVQVTDPVTFGVVLHNGETGFPDITSVMFKVNGVNQTIDPIPLVISSGNKKAALTKQVNDLLGIKYVQAEFKNDQKISQGCILKGEMHINYENAEFDYTGVELQATQSATSGKARVQLLATFLEAEDRSPWRPGWPVPCITFYLYEPAWPWKLYHSVTVPIIPELTPSGYLTGVASAPVEIDLGAENYKYFLVFTSPYSCNQYYADSTYSSTSLLVYRAAGDFITGGGTIKNSGSGGLFSGYPGSPVNFGFHVKFNKKSTNLIGGMNIIFNHEVDGKIHEFQIKTNDILSLGVNNSYVGAQVAEFTSKAILKDLTNGSEGEGNLRLHVTMTDWGEPPKNDSIGFTLWRVNSKGVFTTLLYSNCWFDSKTYESPLRGGNLVIHRGFPEDTLKSNIKISSNDFSVHNPDLLVYPNPFNKTARFEFMPQENTSARIDIFDITGRKISTPFNQTVKEGEPYQAEFTPDSKVSAIYLYRFTIGNQVIHDKIIYKK